MTGSHRKVVARYTDGRIVKGYTFDFGPSQSRFHVFAEPMASGPSTLVLVRDLKAVFFVRDFVGNPARQDGQKFPPGMPTRHRMSRCASGMARSWLGRPRVPPTDPQGFFLMPADPESNNLRAYVVAAATRAVYPLEPVARARTGASSGQSDRSTAPASFGSLLPGRLLSWLTR